jgi:Sulfite exporter TauE/SafE
MQQIIGTIIDKMVPNQALTISLVILLAYTACSTLIKARSQYIGENRAREMKRQAIHFESLKSDGDTIDKISDIFQDDLVVGIETEDGYISANPDLPDQVKSNVDEVASLIESEKYTPIRKVCLLVLMVTIVVGLNILKGGGGKSPLGIKCGTAEYWALTVFIMFWMCTVSLWVRSKLIQKWNLKQRIKYCSVEGDIEWNERNTIVYPLLCSFAGLLAGLFGVGGGIVNGPLMLHLGVHPSVSAATSAVMIIATSAAASTMFIFITLTWDYALFLFLIGTVSTIIGQFGVGYFVDKYRRYSYISISIGFVLLISAFLLGVQSLFIITDTANLTGEYLCTV